MSIVVKLFENAVSNALAVATFGSRRAFNALKSVLSVQTSAGATISATKPISAMSASIAAAFNAMVLLVIMHAYRCAFAWYAILEKIKHI